MPGQMLPRHKLTRKQRTSFLEMCPPLPQCVSLCVPPGFTGLVTFEIKGGVIMRRSALSENDMRCTPESHLNITHQARGVPAPLNQSEQKPVALITKGKTSDR
jgi:hypothetical protein